MSHKSPKSPEPDRNRKEKVLHTRIPAALEDEIKRLAEALSIPVSNLVRNILQDTVSMVDTVREHVGGAVTGLRADVQTLSSHVERDRQVLRRRWAEYQSRGRVPDAEEPTVVPQGDSDTPDLDGVFGWQPMTLNIEARCASCERHLAPGDDAYLGLGDQPGRIFICPECLPRPGERRKP